MLRKRLYKNGLGQILTQRDAGIADLADQAGVAADQPDSLLLAQPHFPEASNDVWLCGELLDANHGAGLHMREWARGCLSATVRRAGLGLVAFFHHGEANSGE